MSTNSIAQSRKEVIEERLKHTTSHNATLQCPWLILSKSGMVKMLLTASYLLLLLIYTTVIVVVGLGYNVGLGCLVTTKPEPKI